MIESNFVDYVKIYVRSGKGGNGITHFQHKRNIPFGGPDGGDGGNGGNIILQGNQNYWTLLHLKYEHHFFAGDGESGVSNVKHGKNGKDKIILLPIGTLVYDSETNKLITDIKYDNQKIILLKGGKGGRGNFFFKSATNQTPKYSQLGEDYKEKKIIFQLKLLADVGLVGFPNVGKSTLLSVISSAKPKIANYAFTTLKPNLGIIKVCNSHRFIMADIPGIINGASVGKGLGFRFLRHVERNSLLLFMIASDSEDIISEYKILLKELNNYNPQILKKKQLLAISKSDMLDTKLKKSIEQKLPKNIPHIFLSSFIPESILKLKKLLWEKLK